MQLKKLLFILLILLSFVQVANAQFVRIKFINNCPDVSVSAVDIYINGTLAVDDLNFRNGTAFVDYSVMPPNNVVIGIAPFNKPFITDTFLSVSLSVSLTNANIMVINGVKSTTGYTPYKKAGIDVYSNAREDAITPGTIDYLLANGSTDMTTFDAKTGLSQVADDISYQGFAASYATVSTTDFKLRLTNTTGTKIINTYNADLSAKGFGDDAVIILASGFVDPASNSNGPAFGLYVTGSNAGPLLPLSTTTAEPITRVQFINNSSDALMDTVDVYIDGVLKFDDWPLHNATPFEDYVAGIPMVIDVAPKNSVDNSSPLYSSPVTLNAGKRYIFMANGIKTAVGYTPPATAVPYTFNTTQVAQEDAALSGNTDIYFVQGSTDAASMDVSFGATSFGTGIGYSDMSLPYKGVTGNDKIKVTMGTDVTEYEAKLTDLGLQNKAVTIVASGFVKPASNAKGPAFGLYLATSTGGPMIKLNPVVSVYKTNALNKLFSLSPNPALNTMHITAPANMQITNADVLDVTGKVVLSNVPVTNNNINITTLNSGVYILHMMANTDAVNIRFVKQ